MVSGGHVGGIRGSGIVSSAADVIGMSVARGMRGVCGVCVMCMCLARGGMGKRIGFWVLPILWEQGKWCLCLDQGLECGVLLCLCEL